MNDRELIEQAAKAMGLGNPYAWDHWPKSKKPAFINDQNDIVFFDPLADDQDAFRLAVKLKIGTCFADGVVTSMIMGLPRGTETPVLGAPVPLAGDPCAATRRAIVRAAAEIGKKVEAPLVRAD